MTVGPQKVLFRPRKTNSKHPHILGPIDNNSSLKDPSNHENVTTNDVNETSESNKTNGESNGTNDSISSSSAIDHKPQGYKNAQVTELTKNSYYCISRLPALPPVLTKQKNKGSVLNGYSDHISNYAVTVSEDGIFVWPYESIDNAPLTIEFPLGDFSSNILPLAILTKPASGATNDPGIVIINACSGLLKFYESVQHSPALGIISDKNLEITVSIKADKGEFIAFVENVEPAGIIIVTSWKRVVLISIRDHKSKPCLSTVELMKPVSKGITGFFNNSDDINDDIICIRSGYIHENNSHQEIIIQEKSGLVTIFTIKLSSMSTGEVQQPQVDPSMSFSCYLNLENSLDGFDNISGSNITYLDIWRLNAMSSENIYLILCIILDPYQSNADSLVLVTAKMDQSGVLVYGSYKSNRFNSDMVMGNGGESGSRKPCFYIPTPESTAFININNSIILTDIDYSYTISKGTVPYHKPKWEDIITLSNDVEIIGYGYENQGKDSNPAIVLLTSNSGVIRVERFMQSNNTITDESGLDPVHLVKSHIEQAIFYSSSSIDFTLTGTFSPETISNAIIQIVDEIINSTSKYLPSMSDAIGYSLLDKKCKLFKNLLNYCGNNFTHLDNDIILLMVHSLEKTQVSLHVWNTIDSHDKLPTKLKRVLVEQNKSINNDEDIRRYLNEDIPSINVKLTEMLNQIINSSFPSDFVLNLITNTLYDGVLLNELPYSQQLINKKSWIFDTDLILVVEKYFRKEFCNDSSMFTNPHTIRTDIGKLCHVLYYFINEAISYMKLEGNDELTSYIHWYNKHKTSWVQCLLSNNLTEVAITLVEQYHDFTSLSQILEDERENTNDQYGLNSIEYNAVLANYYGYFEKYNYEFARALFDYYIKYDKIQILLTGFPRYKHLLDQYLQENHDKVSNVAWIRKLMDNEFDMASKYLIKSTELNPDEGQSSLELKYSLAKLSAIATPKTNNGLDLDLDLDGTLFSIETKLILIRIQKSLFQYISEALVKGNGHGHSHGHSNEVEIVQFESFVKFLNDKINQDAAKSIFDSSFNRFINNQNIPELSLIDYLTLVKPSGKYPNGFSNAFKVATLLPDEKSYKFETKKIWCRLLAITDDWNDIKNTKDQTDDYVRRKVQNSVLYKTILSFDGDKEINILEEMLNDNESIFEDDNILLSETNKSYFNISINYVNTYDLLSWIKSIKTEVSLNT